jgi:primosomal protein N' (replication factor Y)
MDADSTSRRNSHDDILGAFRRREAEILLGTQMIAKGLDFPNVTLVGVLNADSSLNMADFRAEERTFQLLSQVSGRAGRSELPGEVFIQTRDPSARTIRFAARGDFAEFAENELAGRKRGQDHDLPLRVDAVDIRGRIAFRVAEHLRFRQNVVKRPVFGAHLG